MASPVQADEPLCGLEAAQRDECLPADEIALVELDQSFESKLERIFASGDFSIEQHVAGFDAETVGSVESALGDAELEQGASKRRCFGRQARACFRDGRKSISPRVGLASA